jgi:hypothetical protein
MRYLGDALTPGLIADAVYECQHYARALDTAPTSKIAFKRYFHGASEIHPQDRAAASRGRLHRFSCTDIAPGGMALLRGKAGPSGRRETPP